jgi:hypothetical protein
MPDLNHTLQGADLGFLRMVAGAWGFELESPDAKSAFPLLVEALRDPRLVPEVVESLPEEAIAALRTLAENEGRILWAAFTRRFGEVRPMGPARRDRERPDLHPASIAEILWYRVLIGKAFLHFAPAEPQEYAYVPDDLLDLLPAFPPGIPPAPGRAASPGETAFVQPASDRILDHACTLLAAYRSGLDPLESGATSWGIPQDAFRLLLRISGLLDAAFIPIPEATRAFLEAPRPEALVQLAQSWMESGEFNELRLLPGLICEGEWANNPLHTRQVLMEELSQVPDHTWWSLPSFLNAIKDRLPDFQRPAGDYDSWFIRRQSDGTFLRGFSSWDDVDGALIRFLITGPLHWLGFVDLAAPSQSAEPDAFRFSPLAVDLWHGAPPQGLSEETGQLQLTSTGRLRLLPGFPRTARYQVARFCQWEGEKDGEYLYQLSPAGLERARQQGLRPAHLITLLRKHTTQPLPPSLLQALERWEKFGTQAALEQVKLLRLASPEILAALRKTRAGRFLGEALSPTVVVLKPGGESALHEALAEMGILTDF